MRHIAFASACVGPDALYGVPTASYCPQNDLGATEESSAGGDSPFHTDAAGYVEGHGISVTLARQMVLASLEALAID
jgi:hypothetical protein